MCGTTGEYRAGCSKSLSSKAAGESKPEAYPLGYVEDFDEPRTKLADFFSILLANSCNPRHHSPETRSIAPCRPRGWGVASNSSTASLQRTERPFSSHRQKWNMAPSSSPIARPLDAAVSPEPGFPRPVQISTVQSSSEQHAHRNASLNGCPGCR